MLECYISLDTVFLKVYALKYRENQILLASNINLDSLCILQPSKGKCTLQEVELTLFLIMLLLCRELVLHKRDAHCVQMVVQADTLAH